MTFDSTPRLEVWNAGALNAPDIFVVLTAGLVDELRSDRDDPRREQLAMIVSQRLGSLRDREYKLSFDDLILSRTIARPYDGERSLV